MNTYAHSYANRHIHIYTAEKMHIHELSGYLLVSVCTCYIEPANESENVESMCIGFEALSTFIAQVKQLCDCIWLRCEMYNLAKD